MQKLQIMGHENPPPPPPPLNLLHKLHILGHFFSIKSGLEVHIACDNVVPQPLSKSAQFPNEMNKTKL